MRTVKIFLDDGLNGLASQIKKWCLNNMKYVNINSISEPTTRGYTSMITVLYEVGEENIDNIWEM